MVSQTTDRFNGYVASLAFKVPCVVASATNLTLNGAQTVAGIAVVTGDRVLVMAQTDPIENGIYLVTSGAWDRAPDFDGRRDATTNSLVLAAVDASDPILYKIDTATPFIIGEDAVNFSVYLDPSGGVLPHTHVEIDITDLGNYSVVGHTHLLVAGATDVTATFSEVNLLDLGGLTAGWVLSADTASTASWKAPTGGGGGGRINTDINTATPPASEAVTGRFEIYDLADDDELATFGFNGSHHLEIKNEMTLGEILFYADSNIGTNVLVARMHGGTVAQDHRLEVNRLATFSNRSHSGSPGQPHIAVGDVPLTGASAFLGIYPGVLQQYNNDLTIPGQLDINTVGGNVNIGPLLGTGSGTVQLGWNGRSKLQTTQFGVNFKNTSSTLPNTGTVGADVATKLTTSSSIVIAQMIVRASDDSARLEHEIHGQPWHIIGQNSAGSGRVLTTLQPDGASQIMEASTNEVVLQTTTAALGGIFVRNTLTGAGLERVLTVGDVGGGSTTSWSTGGGSTYETGSSSGFQSGAVQTFESGSILEIEESTTMADPAAGFARVWARDAVPNVLAFTNDVGDDFDLETTIRKTESVTATNVITAIESGTIFYLNTATGFTSTLPAPAAGLHFTFIVATAPTTSGGYIITTNAGANILEGTFLDIVGELQAIAAQDTLTFVFDVSLVGDRLEVESDGTSWFCTAFSKADGGITVSVT